MFCWKPFFSNCFDGWYMWRKRSHNVYCPNLFDLNLKYNFRILISTKHRKRFCSVEFVALEIQNNYFVKKFLVKRSYKSLWHSDYITLCLYIFAGFGFGILGSGRKCWSTTSCPPIEEDWSTCIPLIPPNFGPRFWRKLTPSECSISWELTTKNLP